jgi:pimeloyl-ACP methyl ester carboxylesterase
MKHLITVGLVLAIVACGGGQQHAPQVDEPTVAPPRQGSVAASDGVEIAYTVRGEGSPSLVFIHGWMCDQSFWQAQIEGVADGHTVVTVDLAGHGLSGTDREGWPLMAFGTDVQSVVEHLDLDRVILVGHSMGGPVALEAARLMPQRVIGVIGADTLQDADATYEPGQVEAMVESFRTDFAGSCNRFVRAMFLPEADQALANDVATLMCDGSPEVGVTLMEQYVDYDLGAALEAVDVPVRCINAGMWPTDLEANRAHHEDFDAVIIDGVGHFLMMEDPERFNTQLALMIREIEEASPK